ncbi:MAG: hypothetical protein E7Z84_06610 [Methanosphaera stadtmanae]|nr:hypothetical protein [Methanosphaera stadtmanae]
MEIEEFTRTLNNRTIPLHEMKPIVLGLYCYRQMSDKLEYYMNKVLLKREYAEEIYDKELWVELQADENGECIEKNIEIDDDLRIEFRDINKAKYATEYRKIKIFTNNYLHYFIEPEYLFSELIFKLTRNQEIYEDLIRAFENISEVLIEYTELSNLIEEENESLDKLNIFQNINLKIFEDKKGILYDLIKNISRLDFNMEDNNILIANYEYLNNFFANNIKTTEYFTVPSISKLIAKIVAPKIAKYDRIYDPTFGIGSTFIEILKETRDLSENKLPTLSTYNAATAIHDEIFLDANEINQSVYNEAIMNMIIHNVPYYDFDIVNTNTIDHPKEYTYYNFSVITADLPLGLKYQGNIEKLSKDPRFKEYGKLSKRNTDFLFILDMIYNLSEEGIIVTTVSPQTLFAEGLELNTRKQLIEHNYIEAVIKLAPIYYNTQIEPSLLILKKKRNSKDILFIDASKEFIKNNRINELSEENIQKIIDTYNNQTETKKFSHIAAIDEVKSNNYNLDTKMYVNTYEKTNINTEELYLELKEVKEEIKKNNEELKKFFKNKENPFGF